MRSDFMNLSTLIVLVIVIVIFVAIVVNIVLKRKKGKATFFCDGDCANCHMHGDQKTKSS